METLQVRGVATAGDLAAFIRLPWQIYADDPQWVPPLEIEVREFLDRRKHPFYLHGDALPFVAWCGRQPVGRILVSDDPLYNQFHGSNVGCFGMFESIEDPAVARALLEAAAGWLRARGRTAIMGPIDYSTNYACGLLIEGFDTPPRIMMNHHRPYYAHLLESWGLIKVKDLYAWWFEGSNDMICRWRQRAESVAKRHPVVIRAFRMDDFEAEVDRCNRVYDAAYQRNWGFVPLTRAEFTYFARRLARFAVTDQVLLAEVDGKTVGFSVTVPDLNEAIRPLNGRLTTLGLPIGWLRLVWRARKIKTARVLVLVVLEGYRRRGISELLILRTLDYGKNVLKYNAAELSWTLEENHLINHAIQNVGARRYKTYRIYERAL